MTDDSRLTTLSAGDRVDRYEVAELIGSGGMGEVYRARDPKLERDVALKILRPDPYAGDQHASDGHARLLREARAVATLSHPNVLAVYDVGEVEAPARLRGMAYIAMELVVGRPLRAYIGDAAVPVARRVEWLVDVARALGAAHQAGVVHRDVKPENVMIRSDGIVKVLDFGVARRSVVALDTVTSTEAHSLPTGGAATAIGATTAGISSGSASTAAAGLVGTLYYMAPEQLLGEKLDGRADQFAWGVLAYELLLGEGPWTARLEPIKVVSQILSPGPRPPIGLEGQLPPGFSEAVLRALSRDPAARFPSMGALLATVEGIASTRGQLPPSEAPPPSSSLAASPPPPKRAPRGAGWVTVAIAGGAILVAGAVAALVSARARSTASAAMPPPPPASSPAGCTSSAACALAHGGGAWRCESSRHECVALESADCKALAQPSDFTNDETVWIGGMFPTTGEDAADFASETRALDLARQDFASALGSSAARAGDLHARPIGVVLCDETADPLRAATHLARDVEAPAVVGFRWAQTALSVIPSVFLPSHVLSFVSISQAADLNRIPEPPGEPRLVWRSTLDSSDIAAPLAALVSDVLEPRLHAAASAAGARDATTRVAIVRWKEGSRGFAEAAFHALQFNGKSALANGDDFRQFVFDEETDGAAMDVVDALLAFQPQIVFAIGADFPAKVLLPLEAGWRGAPRPIYLVPAADFGPEITAFAGRDPERRHRFFGATNVSSRMANAELVLRYNLAFPREPVTRTVAPQPSYDAFYVLAYAALSLGSGRIDGPALSRAIGVLEPPGKPIDVGPAHIFDAFSALRAGGRIDLDGAIGSLDFDPATGEAPIDYDIVCLGTDEHGAAAKSTIESGLVYDSGAKKLRGALHCP